MGDGYNWRDHHTGVGKDPETGQVMGRDFSGPSIDVLSAGPDSDEWREYCRARNDDEQERADQQEAMLVQDKRERRQRVRRSAAALTIGAMAVAGIAKPGWGFDTAARAVAPNMARTIDAAAGHYDTDSEKKQAAARVKYAYYQLETRGPSYFEEAILAYRKTHPGDVVDNRRRVDIQDAIERAPDRDALEREFTKFADMYGFSASLDHNVPVEEAKQVVGAYVTVLARYPTSFIKKAALKELRVDRIADALFVCDDAASIGCYDPNEESISVLSGAEDGGEYGYVGTVAHELGHALHFDLPESIYDPRGLHKGRSAMNRVKDLVDIPEDPSIYATTSPEELRAELARTVLSHDPRNGLAPPRDWRRFGSNSNEHSLTTLIILEAMQPGIVNFVLEK
jgi:hypothetical protein